jgi:hypothetical protein
LNRFSSEEGTRIMQSLTKVALISCLLSTSVFAFGQTVSTQADNAPTTRAEVRADLVRLEKAGYRPNKIHYPADIQAVEAKLAASNDSSNVVGGAGESSASGHAIVGPTTEQMLYRHH